MNGVGAWLEEGLHHQSRGRLAEAEAAYRRVLRRERGNADAWHLLGVIQHLKGRAAEAEAAIRQAIALRPGIAEFHRNLGLVLAQRGELEGAAACFSAALRLKPAFLAALVNLAEVEHRLGRFEESAAAFRRALDMDPANAGLYHALGKALSELGRQQEAQVCFEQAVRLDPALAAAYVNLAAVLAARGRYCEALAHLDTALTREPGSADAYTVRGIVFERQQRLGEALAAYAEAWRRNPACADPQVNTGNILAGQGRLDEAIAAYRRALKAEPEHAQALANLGIALARQGQAAEGAALLARSVQLRPEDPVPHSNYLLTLHYGPGFDGPLVFQEHRRWAERHARPLEGLRQPHPHLRDPERRLRIGYVSPDFRAHSVAFFLEPVLEAHDTAAFEPVCFSGVSRPDAVTARLQSLVPQWHDIHGMTDGEVASLIRREGIDILVDLAGHTAGNRLLVFARKPAPVQVTWLGYPDTTGLEAIDYRITDQWADPPGSDSWHTETLERLPHGFLCYRPPDEAPEVAPPPALRTGTVTFGSFNNLAKVTPQMVELWASILAAVPGSRLAVKAYGTSSGEACARLLRQFARSGIPEDRVRLLAPVAGLRAHLECYSQIDIALDTFPYHGATTTCEALWMGVPVVSLAGTAHVSRVGVSLLSRAGLEEWIARSPAEYVERAVGYAGRTGDLAALRSRMRERMQPSLTAAARFTRSLEAAYRRMWRRWCAGEGGHV
jgi:predicted O-linked N-acetylglucosamine transferase (SPINDLY family)